MSGRGQLHKSGKSFLGKMLLSLVLLVLLQSQQATAQLSASDPLGFFTNLSSRLLQSEFGLRLNQIQIYPTNQYTPAVHRLLQVTANLWETQTNSEAGLPTVFRPRFRVTNGAIYISGYVLVTNNSDLDGLPLFDLTASTNAASLIPPNGNVLIYGVPLVIGARKGLPNFNEFSMESTFVLTRKLELRKSSLGGGERINQTNQFFILLVMMPIATEFWNSYASNYTRPVSIFVTNRTTMRLTNDLGVDTVNTFVTGAQVSSNIWPQFWAKEPDSTKAARSFVTPLRTNVPILPLVGYVPLTGFVNATNDSIFDTSQALLVPRWGMTITNHVQAKIVDQATGQIIDYVLLGAMTSHRNLTEEFSNPIIGSGDAFDSLWATNILASGQLSGKLGIVQQINISRGVEGGVDLSSSRWRSFGTFTPNNVSSAVAGFNQFFQSGNTNLVATVPFSPSIQFAVPMIWQANDPLVHYLASELFDMERSGPNNLIRIDPPGFVLNTNTLVNIGTLNKRYKPWPTRAQPVDDPGDQDALAAVNPAFKDPLVCSSDDWNFPTNTPLAIETLGGVHRGTPWQTIYLKSAEVALTTWQNWARHDDAEVAQHTQPMQDWPLVAIIQSLLNTNAPQQLLSVNDRSADRWRAVFDRMQVLTNTGPTGVTARPQFEALTMTSNSPQAALLAQAIAITRENQPGQMFRSLGDLLATAELTTASPWLNPSTVWQQLRGMTDEAYEKIPAQLLSRVRADSVGSVLPNGAAWQIQFTGFDNYPYAIQCSTNLVNWISVSTNYPTNGVFTFADSSIGVGSKRFYRSVLLP